MRRAPGPGGVKKTAGALPRIVAVELDLNYQAWVSCAHSAPVGAAENWAAAPDAPTGFPGWHGELRVRFSKPSTVFASDLFRGTILHIGTGSSSEVDSQYAASLFATDFPAIAPAWRQVAIETISQLSPEARSRDPFESRAIECRDAQGHFFAAPRGEAEFHCDRVWRCAAAPAGYAFSSCFKGDAALVARCALPLAPPVLVA